MLALTPYPLPLEVVVLAKIRHIRVLLCCYRLYVMFYGEWIDRYRLGEEESRKIY